MSSTSAPAAGPAKPARLAGLLPDMTAALVRFPVPASCALAWTIYVVVIADRYWYTSWAERDMIPQALSLGFLGSLFGTLLGEGRGRAWPTRVLTALVVAAPFGLLGYLGLQVQLLTLALHFSLLLALGLAPFVVRPRNNESYWRFNHDLWTDFAASYLGAILFASGLWAILETLKYLFGFEPPYLTTHRFWIVAMGLIAPWTWLALITRDFSGVTLASAPSAEGAKLDRITRAVGLLVKFVLAPLLLVYAVILHAYAVKIGFAWTLPKGHLGWLVSTYGCLGAVTLLLAYPERETSGPIVRLFWRFWFLLLIVPVGLLGVAIATRIQAYGVTYDRYVVALLGVWLLGTALWYSLVDRSRDLRVLLASLCVLLAATSFGPWGAVGLSVSSQWGRIAGALAHAGALKYGVISAAADVAALSGDDYSTIQTATSYLNEQRGYRGASSTHESNWTKAAIRADDPDIVVWLGSWLGQVKHEPAAGNSSVPYYYFSASEGTIVALPRGGELIGPVNVTHSGGGNNKPVKVGDRLETTASADAIEIKLDGQTIALPLDDIRKTLAKQPEQGLKPPMVFPLKTERGDVQLMLEGGSLPRTAPGPSGPQNYITLRYWLLVSP